MSAGRPATTQEEKDVIFHKLEPYLKTGLSLYKACLAAEIPKSRVYELINEDQQFAEKIDASKNYLAILTSSMFHNMVVSIGQKIKESGDVSKLDKEELKLLKWYVTKSKTTKEEFGDRVDISEKPDFSELEENPDVLRTILKSFEALKNNLQNLPEDELVSE